MAIFDASPSGNEMSELEPARYLNLAIEQIEEITDWLRTSKKAAQPLLIHLEVFVYLSDKYMDVAEDVIGLLDIQDIEKTFFEWYDRCNAKIPKEFRDDIKASATSLFTKLKSIDDY